LKLFYVMWDGFNIPATLEILCHISLTVWANVLTRAKMLILLFILIKTKRLTYCSNFWCLIHRPSLI